MTPGQHAAPARHFLRPKSTKEATIMPADYSTTLDRDCTCPCVQLNYGTKRGAIQGCALCHGSTLIDRALLTRFYERFLQEQTTSGEWDLSLPPTMPIRETPMRLPEILAPGGLLTANRAAIQTVEHVTYWVCPDARTLGQFYLAAKPYQPKEVHLRRGIIADLEQYMSAEAGQLAPHPRSTGWYLRDVAEVGHGR
jgi:hypothetical protein